MLSVTPATARKVGALALATTLIVGPIGAIAHAQAPETVLVVGCTGSVGSIDADTETDDDEVQTGEADDGPTVVGTVKAPQGASENDKRLRSLATISPDQAQQAALAALDDASHRQVHRVEVEAEHGYVVYAVKTRRNGPGPNQELEVKVDAGNGAILMIECDANDD